MSGTYAAEIQADKLRLVYSLMPVGLIATIINAGVVALLHVNLVPHGVLAAWFSLLASLSVARGVVWLLVGRQEVAEGRRGRLWTGFFVAGITLSGLLWGSAAAFQHYHTSEPHRILVAYVLGGMTAGAAGTFAALRFAYIGFSTFALLPQIVLFAASGDEMNVAMAGMLAFFWVLLGLTSEENRRITESTFRLRYEKQECVVRLSRAYEVASRGNAALKVQIRRRCRAEEELREEHGRLEARVRERTAELAELNRTLEAANRELGEFTHSASHDLRSPLRAIITFADALQQEYGAVLDDAGRNYVGTVIRSASRMNELIEDLLRLSQISQTSLHRVDVDLTELVREVVAGLQLRQAPRSVETVIEEGVVVFGDPPLLRIVLENLFENAWKFTARVAHPHIAFGCTAEGGRTVYFVADNGVGFDMKHAEQIFIPFKRLHSADEYPGTGIGLATAQRVIRRHGGEIWAQSQPGKGTTIFFTLSPRDDASAGESEG